MTSHYYRIRFLYGKIDGIEQSIIDEHEQIVDAARKRDVVAMRKVVMEHSNNLLNQVNNLSKQYPHYFQNTNNHK